MPARLVFVSTCSSCPFMHWDVQEASGCEHPDNGEPGFTRAVEPNAEPPPWCPLRVQPSFVLLEGGPPDHVRPDDHPTPREEVS